jgi:hypothetical protein
MVAERNEYLWEMRVKGSSVPLDLLLANTVTGDSHVRGPSVRGSITQNSDKLTRSASFGKIAIRP